MSPISVLFCFVLFLGGRRGGWLKTQLNGYIFVKIMVRSLRMVRKEMDWNCLVYFQFEKCRLRLIIVSSSLEKSHNIFFSVFYKSNFML